MLWDYFKNTAEKNRGFLLLAEELALVFARAMADGTQLRQTRVVFMGTPAFALPSLNALADVGSQIVGVATQPDKPTGRGRAIQASAVGERAAELGLPVWKPKGLKNEENQKFLRDLKPDLLVVVAYGNILPKRVLDLPKHGAVNVHASLLPKYRGPGPVPAAILQGELQTGVTIMKLDEGVDTGPILAQERVPIAPDDTAARLTSVLADKGARLLLQTLGPYLRGELSPSPQDDARATRAPLLTKDDGAIVWSLPAARIARMVRAYDPWPRTETSWNGKRVIIRKAAARPRTFSPPGLVFRNSEGVNVATGDGALLLEELHMEDRKPLPAETFVRGYPSFIGSILGGPPRGHASYKA